MDNDGDGPLELSLVSSHSQVGLLPHSRNSEEKLIVGTISKGVQYQHLKERLEPSSLLFYAKTLSQTATNGYMSMLGYFFFLINFRFIYLRVVNRPNDLVSLLMINILAQMGVEFLSTLCLIYGGDQRNIFYKRFQLVFGWKSVCLLVTLVLSCVLTVIGTVSDFPQAYQRVNLIQMASWRGCLTMFCFLLSNDNTYMAHLYFENFFTRSSLDDDQTHKMIYLTSFVDRSCDDTEKIIVVEKSSQADILCRVKELMPTFILLNRILKVKSVFNLLNSAIFFILSLGVIGHSENNGMFYYNVFMIGLMSIISYTSFETISQYNLLLDKLDSALEEGMVRLHLHVRVSSYAVDDRFLTITAGAAFLQVVLKTFGIS